MANANPPPIKVPAVIRKVLGAEGAGFFDKLVFMIFQLWERTGGGDDLIDNSINTVYQNDTTVPAVREELTKRIDALELAQSQPQLARFTELEQKIPVSTPDTQYLSRIAELERRIVDLEQRPTLQSAFYLEEIRKLVEENQQLYSILASQAAYATHN